MVHKQTDPEVKCNVSRKRNIMMPYFFQKANPLRFKRESCLSSKKARTVTNAANMFKNKMLQKCVEVFFCLFETNYFCIATNRMDWSCIVLKNILFVV